MKFGKAMHYCDHFPAMQQCTTSDPNHTARHGLLRTHLRLLNIESLVSSDLVVIIKFFCLSLQSPLATFNFCSFSIKEWYQKCSLQNFSFNFSSFCGILKIDCGYQALNVFHLYIYLSSLINEFYILIKH